MNILHILRNNKFGGTQVLASNFNDLNIAKNTFLLLEKSDFNYIKSNTKYFETKKEIVNHINNNKYDLIISYVGLHTLRFLFKVRKSSLFISAGSKLNGNMKNYFYSLLAKFYPRLKIVCTSKTVEDSYKIFGFKNLVIIPNPLRDSFLMAKPKSRETISSAAMTGRIDLNDSARNWDLFCQLSKKFKSLKFVAIGDGIMRKKLTMKYPFIDFKGNLDEKELISTLEKVDVFLHLNNQIEGFGIALYEAMALGCIPIAPDIPINREIIEHRKNGFLYKNIEQLESLILLLLNSNSKQINNLSRNAMASITQKFTKNYFLNLITENYYSLNRNDKD
jgi:glycosyltransferase involved in cell wall biosynthesis